MLSVHFAKLISISLQLVLKITRVDPHILPQIHAFGIIFTAQGIIARPTLRVKFSY